MKNTIKTVLALTLLMSFFNIIPVEVVIFNDSSSTVIFEGGEKHYSNIGGYYTESKVLHKGKTATLKWGLDDFDPLKFYKKKTEGLIKIPDLTWSEIPLIKKYKLKNNDIAVVRILSKGFFGRFKSEHYDIKIIKNGEKKDNKAKLIKEKIKELRR